MLIIIGVLILFLAGLIVGAVVVIIALLKRLDTANSLIMEQAKQTLAMAESTSKSAPRQMDKMLESLASATAQIHASITSSISTVLTPPPVQYIDQTQAGQYTMPNMQDGKPLADWDPTDALIPDPTDGAPMAIMLTDDYDPSYPDPHNPFGIPGLEGSPPIPGMVPT